MGCEHQLNMENFVIGNVWKAPLLDGQKDGNEENSWKRPADDQKDKNEENKEDFCAGESNHCRCRLIDLFAFDWPLYCNQLYPAYDLFAFFILKKSYFNYQEIFLLQSKEILFGFVIWLPIVQPIGQCNVQPDVFSIF